MAYTRDQYEKEIRRISGDEGVPSDMMVRLWKTESGGRPVDIGYHYPNDPNKTAYGPWGITKDFAKDFSPEGEPDSWKDPIGGIYTAIRGLQSHYKRFGNWPQAIEGYKLGPGNVGNLAFRKEHPNEWKDVSEIIEGAGSGGGGGGTTALYPGGFGAEMMSAAADRTRVASGEFAGAQTAYDDAFKRPLNLPRMPIPEERSMAGIGIPSLLANLATAISGNPLYQQVQQGRFAGEDEERRQAQQQNLQLSREETVQRRQENLQHMHDRMALAADRLQAAEKYEEEIKMRGEMAKVQEKIQGMEGDQAKERAEIQAKAQTDAQYIRLKGVFAKQGYDLSIDENGEWQIAGGGQAASTIKLKRSERMERVQGWGKIAAETKDPKKAQFAKLQMAMAVTMPDDDDKNWNGLFTRATRELEQIGVPASEIDMLLHAAAFENAGKLPGAAEYYKRIDDALNARKKTGGGKETKETKPKENDFLDKIFGPRSPEHEAWRAARREAIGGAVMGTIHAGQAVGRAIVGGLQSAGGALGEATTMSAEEHASSNVENAQKQVDNLEGLMKRYPEVFSTSDTVAALADAYKQLAKAKKDMEVIKNKGETPKKAQ